MWQLFKNLPSDLRWEVLSEFVGSHAVRKGKLMKRLVVDKRHQLVKDIPPIHKCYIYQYTYRYNAKTFVQLWSGSQLMFCENSASGEMGYLFRKRKVRTHSREPKSYGFQYTPLNDSVKLPPFEKHSYPSYEDTDKKKAQRLAQRLAQEIVVPNPKLKGLFLIRPGDLEDDHYNKRYIFPRISSVTPEESLTSDEPYWLTAQFPLEMI